MIASEHHPQASEDDAQKRYNLHVEGERVNHSWCMGVVCHGYGGLSGRRDGGGGW